MTKNPKFRATLGPFKVQSSELRNMRVRIHGRIVNLYSIGYLATVSGKAKRTLRKYEEDRLLPRPLIRTPSNIRFYLAEEVYEYGTLLKTHMLTQGQRTDLDPSARSDLKERLAQAKDRIRARMQKDINLIHAELKGEDNVKDLAKICRVNRKLRMLETDLQQSTQQ